MPEAVDVTARCPRCGAEATIEGALCARCAGSAPSPAAPSSVAVEKLHETEEKRQSLRARVASTIIYVAVCAGAVYLSVPYFETGDWWFGLMGLGLAAIALVGVKESLFPSEWKTE